MACICYVPKKFSDDHRAIIRGADQVIKEYQKQGLSLTLRQLYYQFVARGWIPNKQESYNKLGAVVSDARLAGLLDWEALEDRTRNLKGLNHVAGPGEAVTNTVADYRIDMWANQRFRPEVWIEKEALEGVIADICNQLRVDFFAVRGYNSQSEQWRAGRRMAGYVQRGQVPIVFHLGDHDPSGLDMTRDNRERLSLFAGVSVTVERIALNMNQIEQFNPPPNPAKMSDSRAMDYIDRYGRSSWELDALSPTYIRDLIRQKIVAIRDQAKWDEMLEEEINDKRVLEAMAQQLRRSE